MEQHLSGAKLAPCKMQALGNVPSLGSYLCSSLGKTHNRSSELVDRHWRKKFKLERPNPLQIIIALVYGVSLSHLSRIPNQDSFAQNQRILLFSAASSKATPGAGRLL